MSEQSRTRPICRTCGYDLSGVADTNDDLCKCPECGNTRFPITPAQRISNRYYTKLKLLYFIALLTLLPVIVLCLAAWLLISLM
jgi:predicted RNA-binding Zn-ribbon protein involved in translation (DUF1610 family)